MRLNLRTKLLLFAIAIAIVPLLVAGRTMIRIAQDELKSSANEQLVNTAQQLGAEIDDLYERTWLAPLVLIRNAVDDERLGVQEKISLLTLGIADIPDIVALQLTVEGAALPLVVSKDDFSAHLKAAGLDPLEVLRVPASLIGALRESDSGTVSEVRHIPQTDDWLATVVLPLKTDFGGGRASLSARIDLERLRQFVQSHPFNRTGILTIVDADGHKVFDPQRTDLSSYEIVAEATRMLAAGTPIISVEPYKRPDGEVMLGAFVFPRPFHWAILVEKRQRDAYLAVEKMLKSLGFWSLIGLAVAGLGAILLALRISRPILKIERVAAEVAEGNFEARVQGVRSRDEVGDLAQRMNEMVVGLNERFHLAKFVSGGTIAAIKVADKQGVRLGGEKRLATMLFCDIRGYTSFAERHDPETVVEVLNLYFQHQADFVAAAPRRRRQVRGRPAGRGVPGRRHGAPCRPLRARDPGQDRRARPRAPGLGPGRRHRHQHRRGDRRRHGQQGPDGLHGPRRPREPRGPPVLVRRAGPDAGDRDRLPGDRRLSRIRRRGADADRGQGQARARAGLPGRARADGRRGAPAREHRLSPTAAPNAVA